MSVNTSNEKIAEAARMLREIGDGYLADMLLALKARAEAAERRVRELEGKP